jgi:hypothetical protein
MGRPKKFIPVLVLAVMPFARVPASVSASDVSAELQQLCEEDQADRHGGVQGQELQRRDTERRQRVDELLSGDLIIAPTDRYHAAMVFQHSTEATDILKAHALASAAAFEGHEKARWLAAASLDRYLKYTKEDQFFGTQFEQDESGRWVPGRTDAALTESLREAYSLPSREELMKRAEGFN